MQKTRTSPNSEKWLITASIHWWHWKLDVKICFQARTGKWNAFNWHTLVHSSQRKQECLLKSRLSNQSARDQHQVCAVQHLASGTGTAQLFFESSTRVVPWAQAKLGYTTVQLSTCIATTMGEGQQRYGEGREEGRNDTITERVSHQHHEITCSEADHCFLQEKTLIRLL